MPRQARQTREPFASAPLVALVVRTLGERDPSLLPPETRAPDYLADAKTDAKAKPDIVDYAYARGGAGPLLAVGTALCQVRPVPALQVLLNSADTGVLADKWMRLERYHHATHRVVVDGQTSGVWSCRRHWRGAQAPSTAENVLICGIMAGLLELFGCRDVAGTIGGIGLPVAKSRGPVFATGDTGSWVLRWSVGAGKSPAGGPAGDASGIVDRLSHLLAADTGRVWRLEEAAAALARSPRSLQRDVKLAGHTFSSVVRGVRASEAARLLQAGDMALSDIGYWCGYADQAHFQRDFRRAVNMTPAEYRSANA